MPKKTNKWNSRGGRSAEDKPYFGHDDRVGRTGGGSHGGVRSRVVSFKTHRPNNRELMNSLALASLDEDIPMIGSNSNNNSRQVVVRGKDKNKWNREWRDNLPMRGYNTGPKNSRSPLPLAEGNWYKIIIPYGHKYDKEYVLRTLLNYMTPEVFIPIMYKTTTTDAFFYVDNQKTANALLNCDRKITMNDGFKLQVRAKPGFPHCNIDDKFKERLKQAMAKRYVQESCALDLSKLYQDPDLAAEYFCALFRPQILMAVLDVMAECVPNLKALNLEGNRLQNFDRLAILSKKFPQLKVLYIGENRMRDIHQLDVLKDLKLDELRLAGNPCCTKYRTRTDEYISDVRKRFPKLLRLDGTELPRPIVFDVVDEDTNKIPPMQRMFVGDEKAKEVASQFLQQYFAVFDSDNRQTLLNAYDEHAMFSMTITTSHINKFKGFGFYLMENRNLFRINDTTRRQKLLKQGRLPVVSFITEMSRTKHLLDTFTMDITLATQTMMFITITGYFQEINTKDQPIRYFNRTFIIVPGESGGYCIRNEQLHISQPPEAQVRQLLQQLNQQSQPAQPTVEPAKSTEMTSVMSETEVTNVEEIKQQMIVNLSQQTNMNMEWSLKCLEETNWNYDNAISAFQEFFNLGQIPSEAFAK